MVHLMNVMFFAGAIILFVGVGLAVKAFFANLRERSAPFRDYFGPEYERDLLRQSFFSETQDWRADSDARFTPFRLREQGTSERRTRVGGSVRRDRDSD